MKKKDLFLTVIVSLPTRERCEQPKTLCNTFWPHYLILWLPMQKLKHIFKRQRGLFFNLISDGHKFVKRLGLWSSTPLYY